MVELIAAALVEADITFWREAENGQGLDFVLENGIAIEVKRFHSPRIAGQMARTNNIIAVQGEVAVRFLADLLKGF